MYKQYKCGRLREYNMYIKKKETIAYETYFGNQISLHFVEIEIMKEIVITKINKQTKRETK